MATAIALAAAIPAVNLGLMNEDVRNRLLQRIASSLDGELLADEISISLDEKSININCINLKGNLFNNALKSDIPDVGIKITYADLLQGYLFPTSIKADTPQVGYTPLPKPTGSGKSLQFDWSRAFNAQLKNFLGKVTNIDIKDGTLSLSSTTFSHLNVLATADNSGTNLNLSTDILYNDSVMPVTINGTSKNPLVGTFSYEFDVNADSIPLNLVPSSPDFFFSGGMAAFSGKLTGGGRQGINVDGNIRIDDFDMTVGWTSKDKTIHQQKAYQYEKGTLTVQGRLQERKINFPFLSLASENFRLQGSFLLDFADIINPYMDLRLKTDEMELATLKELLPDPLINDWTTKNIFPRLENGTATMTDFMLAGTIAEIGGMGNTKNAHCLSWSGILQDVDTFYNDHKPLVKVSRANLSMDGDQFKITNLRGKSKKSTLDTGNLTIAKLYEPTPVLTTDIKGSFALSWLTKLTKSRLFGEEMRELVRPVSSLSGLINGHVTLSLYLGNDLNLKSLKGKGTVIPLKISLKKMDFPVRMKKASFTLAYPGTSTVSGKGSWGKSTFDGRVNLIDLAKKQLFKLNIKPNLTELKKTFTDNQTILSLAPCIATLPIKVDITCEKNSIAASGSLDFSHSIPPDKSKVCKQLLSENQIVKTTFNIRKNGKNLTLKELSLTAGNGNMQVSGLLRDNKKPPVLIKKLHIKGKDFPLQALSVVLPKQNKNFAGTVTTTLDAADFSVDNIWQAAIGRLELTGWHGSLAVPDITVNNLDLKADFKNGRLGIQAENILLADFNTESPLKLQADLLKKDVWSGKVRVHADYTDLTSSPSLFREGKIDLSRRFPISKVDIICGADHVRYRNIIFSPLFIQSYITADRFIISKALLQLDDDFVWFTGEKKGNDVIYTSYFKIYNKPVDTLMAMMGFENEIISGKMNIEGKLRAKVTPGKTVFETATGPISFDVENGTLESSSTLVKILDLISLENIFEKKDILKWKNSFNYKKIIGRFDLADGVFTTDSLVMDASAFDLFAEGSVDILQDTVQMQVKLAPFGTMNKLFSSIPFFGYILTGKSKSLFDYTLSVVGKIGSPNVKYTPLINTVESLTGYVKRLVSKREEVKKKINAQLQVDMAEKQMFITQMKNELADLHRKK
jgi:hypothetical protein